MVMEPGVTLHWPGGAGPPPDVPKCGFRNEYPECQPKGSNLALFWSIVSTTDLPDCLSVASRLYNHHCCCDNCFMYGPHPHCSDWNSSIQVSA